MVRDQANNCSTFFREGLNGDFAQAEEVVGDRKIIESTRARI